jgi:hypothetical protein
VQQYYRLSCGLLLLVVDLDGSLLPTAYAGSTLHIPEITIPLYPVLSSHKGSLFLQCQSNRTMQEWFFKVLNKPTPLALDLNIRNKGLTNRNITSRLKNIDYVIKYLGTTPIDQYTSAIATGQLRKT